MSPEMLTLVAAVLAYDIARETCEVRDVRSSIVEALEAASPRLGRRGAFESRSERSWTRLEKDIAETVNRAIQEMPLIWVLEGRKGGVYL